MHHAAHKTKWTLLYTQSGAKRTFETREACTVAAIECEGVCPVRVIPPIYGDDR